MGTFWQRANSSYLYLEQTKIRAREAQSNCYPLPFTSRINVIGQGWTVENPNDDRNELDGIHWAFKRAIQSMLYRIEFQTGKYFSSTFKKQIDKDFRQALWESTKEK